MNYQTVSNLAFLSKISEKMISTQLVKYIVDNGLTDAFQSAYKCGHFTKTALLGALNPNWAGVNYEQYGRGGGGGGGGHMSTRLLSIKFQLKLQSIAMTLYKSPDQYCSGKGYLTNFGIGLVLAEVIAGLSRKIMICRLCIYLCQP